MTMSGPRLLIGRRHFLTSAAVGAIGVFLPLGSAHAAIVPPGQGAETLTPAPTTAPTPVAVGDSSIIGAAAAFQLVDDPSIRPFHYHAADAELADLKRRIKATKWPNRETVNDTTQGVNLATMQKLADYW